MHTERIVIELDGTGVLSVDADLRDTPFLSRIAADIVRLHETIVQLQEHESPTKTAQPTASA